MSKRQDKQLKFQKQQRRNRLIIVAGVVTVFLIVIVLVLLSTNANPPTQADKEIIQPTPVERDVPFNGTSLGDPNAPVKVDVWEDFQCPGCKIYSETLEPQIIEAYVKTGKVYYTFHVFPFLDGGAGESQQAASAALCAADQERFWEYHDLLFANWKGENEGSFSDTRLVAMAQTLKLDMSAFNECFTNNAHADKIQADIALGKSLGVPPTPGIFVNNELVISGNGPNYIASFEDMAAYIDRALNK